MKNNYLILFVQIMWWTGKKRKHRREGDKEKGERKKERMKEKD